MCIVRPSTETLSDALSLEVRRSGPRGAKFRWRLALAYSDQGQALLEGFNFFKLQNAKVMPDNAALFALQVSDREHLISSLKTKGLDVAE